MSNLAKLNQIQPSNLVPGLRLYVSLNLNEPYFPTTKLLSSQSIRGQPVETRRGCGGKEDHIEGPVGRYCR